MITLEQIQMRLAEAITRSGISQTQIAELLHIKQPTVSQYVSGKVMPALDTFANLCKILDLDANDILCVNDD